MPDTRNTWNEFFPKINLPEDQWVVWETLHEPAIIRKAMAQLAVKRIKVGGHMDLDHMVRFASAVMNRLDREAEANTAQLVIRGAAMAAGVDINDHTAVRAHLEDNHGNV